MNTKMTLHPDITFPNGNEGVNDVYIFFVEVFIKLCFNPRIFRKGLNKAVSNALLDLTGI
jgi:hypothetical protein